MNVSWNKDNFGLANQLLLDYELNSLVYKIKNNDSHLNNNNEEEKEKLPYAKDLFITKTVLTENDYYQLKAEIEKSTIIALDTETFSGDPRTTKIVGFSLCMEEESAWYVPLIIAGERVSGYDLYITLIASIDENKLCVMHNALFDMHVIGT